MRDWSFDEAEGARIATPTLVVVGAETRPWYVENAELLVGMVDSAEIVTLPGLDHLGPLTHPTEVSVVIADFLARLGPAEPTDATRVMDLPEDPAWSVPGGTC